jgi:hypothetical protein
MVDVCVIHTVEQFWNGYDFLPKPSDAFRVLDDYVRPSYEHGVERIRSLCLRRDTLAALEWEDRTNFQGMFRSDIANMDSVRIDSLWETSCLFCIGEMHGGIDDSVNAVRIIDRGNKKQDISTRLEIWCRERSDHILAELNKHLPYSFEWVAFEHKRT